ncbi:MAG: ABC transporter ATP-binding protein [Reyranella sp.]|nr:ABC transporter ATP-binding protein [Reyranella sp.]
MSSSTSSEIVVEAKNLGKAFQLYAHRNDWLKQVLFGWWKAYFKPFWVLRDISLEVKKGESIGILGRNGCGKSTLLQVVCGMTLPSHGELRVNGRIAPVLALGATFDMELSGRENVLIGGAVLGLKRNEILRKFDSIAEFAGIGQYMDQPVKHYSMGMRTRLAFSICAHVEADILVVDEALSVGDAAFQRKCLDWIDNFRKTGTLLFVSHSMAEVRRLCTRAIWIEEGRIREQGDPNDVIRSYHRALLVEKDDVQRFSSGNARSGSIKQVAAGE